MPGVNVTNGGWDSVVSLARSGAADTHIRSKDAGQTLYANRTKLSFSGHKKQIDPETVSERREAAAQAVRAQFAAKFQAQYPKETSAVLQKFSLNKFEDGFRKSDILKMNKLMEKRIQLLEVYQHFDEQPVSTRIGCGCKRSYLDATSNHKGPVNGSGENQKLLSKKESRAQSQKAYRRTLANVAGLAVRCTSFNPPNGFESSSTLRAAMKQSGALTTGGNGAVGADVFLLPEVIDNPELAGVKRTLALSIVANRFEVNPFSLTKDDEGAHDVSLALRKVDPEFDLASAPPAHPKVPQQINLEEYVLDRMLAQLAKSERPSDDFVARLDAAQKRIDDSMARLKNPSDAPAPAQGGKNSARVPDATTAARQALEQAHDTKKLLVLELLEKVGDAELQRAGPKTVSNVVKNTLDGIAGKEGRKYAEKVESGLQAEMNAMQEDVRRGIEGGET